MLPFRWKLFFTFDDKYFSVVCISSYCDFFCISVKWSPVLIIIYLEITCCDWFRHMKIKWQNSTPTCRIDTTQPITKNLITSAKFGEIPPTGLPTKMVKYNQSEIVYTLFLGTHLYSQTHRRIFTISGSTDVDSCKGVSFLDFVDVYYPFMGSNPQNQTKRAKKTNFAQQ